MMMNVGCMVREVWKLPLVETLRQPDVGVDGFFGVSARVILFVPRELRCRNFHFTSDVHLLSAPPQLGNWGTACYGS